MKKLLFVLALALSAVTYGQLDNTQNYIYSVDYKIPVTESTLISAPPASADKLQKVTYFDGQGRAAQSVGVNMGGSGEDVVSHFEYDGMGRQALQYLPYVANLSNDLGFMAAATLKTNINSYYTTNFANDLDSSPNPYSETVFEPFPGGRPIAQGAPGKDWKVNNSVPHISRATYNTNVAGEVMNLAVAFTSGNTEKPYLTLAGTYAADLLAVNRTKKPNWVAADGKSNTVEVFTDAQGRLVLSREYNKKNGVDIPFDTYYVYDVYGNLTFVVPPKASEAIFANFGYGPAQSLTVVDGNEESSMAQQGEQQALQVAPGGETDIRTPPPVTPVTVPAAIVDGLIYEYHYSVARNWLVEKRVPGKGWEYLVYDRLDRPVMTQDANERLINRWTFIKYDKLGRKAYNGQFTYANPNALTGSDMRLAVQALVTASAQVFEQRSTAGFSNGGRTIAYTALAFPTTADGLTVLSAQYYDNYSFTLGFTLGVPTTVNSTNDVTTQLRSLPTGSLVRVLGTNDWSETVQAYDKFARPLWAKGANSKLQTSGTVQQNYNFMGQVLQTKAIHSKTGVTTNLQVVDNFTYDAAGRLSKHTQKIGTQAEQLISQPSYTGIGQVKNEKIGDVITATTPLQQVDYSYNIRGWFTKVNDPDVTLTDDLFAFRLNYNTAQTGATVLYDGNISQVVWKSKTDNLVRKYNTTYDALGRLTNASYVGNYTLAAAPGTTPSVENYTEGNIDYDKNGNIVSLTRYGLLNNTTNQIGVIDQLAYTYDANSNRLTQIADTGDQVKGFTNVNAVDNIDYSYDSNGNMTRNVNKAITSIEYNHLNLPTKIVFDNRDTASANPKVILFTYDANGTRIQKEVILKESGQTQQTTLTQYSGPFTYQSKPAQAMALQFISNEKGYAFPESSAYTYVFQYKDNTGNVRLSYRKLSGVLTVIDQNNFTPFGLRQEGYNNVVNATGNDVAQKFRFNGQEEEKSNGLDVIEMDWRQYDAGAARFFGIDLLAEQSYALTPYHFAGNNPIVFADPSGLKPIIPKDPVVPSGGGALGSFGNMINGNFLDNIHNSFWATGMGYGPFVPGWGSGGMGPGGGGYGSNGYWSKITAALGHTVSFGVGQLGYYASEASKNGFHLEYLSQSSEMDLTPDPESSSGEALALVPTFTYAVVKDGFSGVDNRMNVVDPNFNNYAGVVGNVLTVTDYVRESKIGNFARNGRPPVAGISNALKWGGRVIGGLGLAATGIQLYNGEISKTEAAVDAFFGVVGFLGPVGSAVSLTYFIGKGVYEYSTGETLFEKP